MNGKACVARIQGIRGLFCKLSLEPGCIDSQGPCEDECLSKTTGNSSMVSLLTTQLHCSGLVYLNQQEAGCPLGASLPWLQWRDPLMLLVFPQCTGTLPSSLACDFLLGPRHLSSQETSLATVLI